MQPRKVYIQTKEINFFQIGFKRVAMPQIFNDVVFVQVGETFAMRKEPI